ncbi:MAG: hypothetical protein PHW96_00945 [Candidatus Nanoarchaeia archaeon]|nr:hypothetical protein [Candidatus Nanoarchaeia archaeon]
MVLNELMNFVRQFEIESGFDKTEVKELLDMLQKEVDNLKGASETTGKPEQEYIENKMVDIVILVLQIANRYHGNLDGEWKKHWGRQDKYRTKRLESWNPFRKNKKSV